MSRHILNPVFILLLGIQLEAAHVEPPTNVTLDCHNLVHVVRWSYTEFSPGLKFRIFIGSLRNPPKEFLVDSPNLQADFSLDNDPADTYTLLVSAVVDQKDSEDSEGIRFSYDKNSVAPKKCFMDLTAVNITATQDDSALLSFMHPWLLYRDKLPVKKSTTKKRHVTRAEGIPLFEYDVIITGKGAKKFDCSESVCEEKLWVVPQEEKLCLKISGEMEKMAIEGTEEYCTMPAAVLPAEDFTYIIYIVIALLVLIVLAFILFMVYKQLTNPSSSLPDSMRKGWKDHLWRAAGVREQVSVPVVEPASPTPLLTTTEFPPAFTSSTEPEFRERIGPLREDERVCDGGEIGNDEGHAGGYTQGGNLDEDDTEINSEPQSGYEKRQVFD